MENIGEFMQQYATKEVMTVVVALATAWVGWKAAAKGVGMAKGFAAKASFAGITSAVLLLAGFGGIGAGIGELHSRKGEEAPKQVETQLTNTELVSIASNPEADERTIEAILAYAKERDNAAREMVVGTHTDAQGRTWVLQDAPKKATAELASYKTPYEEDLPFKVVEQPEQAAIKNDESIMTTPIAWTTIGLGLASLIGSFGVFTTRRTNV